MQQDILWRRFAIRAGSTAAVALGAIGLLLASSAPTTSDVQGEKQPRYIGASKCKSCHKSEESGDQYGKWEAARHSKAFETLGSDAAMAIAKEKGIEDPQKADECLRCHVTAFGAPEEHIKKGFKTEAGVQCETCHGPGEDHLKARFAAAAEAAAGGRMEVPAGEIDVTVGEDTCRTCHNEESPTYEHFCLCFFKKIRHLDPRKERTEEELAALPGYTCECEEGCPTEGCGKTE